MRSYFLVAREDFAGTLLTFETLVALAALAAAFLAGALTDAAFFAVVVLAAAVLTLALAGRPGPRDGALFAAATDLRPAPLAAVAAVVVAALVALTAFAGATRPAARPGEAFAAAAFFAADFLALRSALKPVAGLKRMPLDAAIFTGCPVRGLRPVRALRDVGLKLPKP